MSNELSGTLIKDYGTQTFASGFMKRTFVVRTDGQYPQEIPFDLMKERVDQINQIPSGARVKVRFDLRGNEHKGRHYLTAAAWRVEMEAPPQEQGEYHTDDPPEEEEGFEF